MSESLPGAAFRVLAQVSQAASTRWSDFFVLHDVFVSLRSDRYQSDHERSKPLRWEKSVSSSQQLVIFSFLLTRLTRLTRLTLLVPVVQW